MHTLTLNNGYSIPQLGLGTWKSKPGEVYQAVKTAIRLGYRHIDCAPIYGNEKEIGQALSEILATGEISRDELFITSKLWNNRHGLEDVIPALQETLQDLQLEYLDLFLIHWPIAFQREVIFPSEPQGFIPLEKLPISQTWQGMERAVEQGLTKSIGVSNFSVKKLKHLQENARIQPCVNQVECHPFLQQNALLSYCQDHQLILTAYSPLGSRDREGFLKAADEPSLLEHPDIKQIAEKHQATAAQVLIQWALQRGTVVIPKSVSPQRLEENFAAQNLILTHEDLNKIRALERNFRYVNGSFFTLTGSGYTRENLWDESAEASQG